MSKILIVILGLILLAILGYFCIYNYAPNIQDDIHIRTSTALAEQDLDEVDVNTDGRDIILTSEVASEAIKQQAEEYARKVYGVNTVDNQLTVTVAPAELVIEPEATEPLQEPVKQEMIQAPKLEPLPEFTCQQNFDTLLSSNEINFATNSSDIDASSNRLLSDLIEVANQCPEAKIEIGGHTDSSGSDDYNLRLSQARASSVMSYLINNGVDDRRLSAVGYGETNPITDNESDEGKAKNRKIEFNVKGLSQ